MPTLQVRLFGRLDIRCADAPVNGVDARKVQELLCYVLLHRDRLQCRESLADLLWGDTAAAQSRKYLRQALWQLQAAMCPHGVRLLTAEAEWVGLHPDADIWLDVAAFECAYARSKGVPGQALDADGFAALRRGADLCRGELLEGWYQDWCLRDRERLAEMHLAMLDKLMDHCAATGDFEEGLEFGARSLACDHARERTYRRLMRLHLAGGDRTGALRVYERCVEALRGELGVGPEGRTVGLWEAVRGGGVDAARAEGAAHVEPAALSNGEMPANGARPSWSTAHGYPHRPAVPERWTSALSELRHLQATLADIERRLQDDIDALQMATNGQG